MGFVVGEEPQVQAGIGEALEVLWRVGTATRGHFTDFGHVPGLVPLQRPAKAVGLAFTVRIPRLDSAAVHYALGLVQPGQVVVVDTSGETARAPWGGIVTHAAMRAGIAGAVIDAPVCDWDEIIQSGFPIWCRGTTSLTGRMLALEGALQVPIQVSGAVVLPGDVVFADSDGVFFLRQEEAIRVADQLAEVEANEPDVKRRLDAGELLPDISGARAALDALRAETAGAIGDGEEDR